MKNSTIWGCLIGIPILALMIITLTSISKRHFNNMASVVKVHEVAPGVQCAVVTATDSVSISCWPKVLVQTRKVAE